METRLLKTIAGLLVVLAVFAAAFVLPAHKPTPHHVPVGVVGPASAQRELEHARPGAIDVDRYATETEARHAIRHREIYGALLVGRSKQRLLIASAASNTIAQTLRSAVQAQHKPVTVEDLAPLSKQDPRGTTINALFLALVIACSLAVVALTSLGLKGSRLVGALALFAVLGGLAVVGLIGKTVGTLPGSYLALSGCAALTMLALLLPTAGLQRLFGQAGAALGGLTFMLIANPASGNASAPELLPTFWRNVSQLMPPGAGGTTLRNTAYFDGNALLSPLLVLTTYAAAGFVLVLLGERLRRRRTRGHDLRKPTQRAGRDLEQAA